MGREARAGESGGRAGQGRLAPAEPLPRRWAGRGRRLLCEACSSGVARRRRAVPRGLGGRIGTAGFCLGFSSGDRLWGVGLRSRAWCGESWAGNYSTGLRGRGIRPVSGLFRTHRDRGAGPLTQTPELRPGDRAPPSRQHECGARTPVSGPARLLPASQAGGGLLTPPLLRRRSREASEPGSAAWLDRVGWWCERKAGVPGGAAGRRRLRLAGLPRGGRALYGPGATWPLPSTVEGVGCFSVTGSAPGDFRVRMRNWPYGVWCGECGGE